MPLMFLKDSQLLLRNTRVIVLIQLEFWRGVGYFAYKTINDQQVFSACLELVWRFEQRTFYIGSLGAKVILTPLSARQNELDPL